MCRSEEHLHFFFLDRVAKKQKHARDKENKEIQMLSSMDPKAMKDTRRSHRHILRAADAQDMPAMRAELESLYSEGSALTRLTNGPSPICLVPVVDAYVMAAAKGKHVARAELMDNLVQTGKSFGLTGADLGHIQRSGELAAAAVSGRASDPDRSVRSMRRHLGEAGFGGVGLCMPDAIAQSALHA